MEEKKAESTQLKTQVSNVYGTLAKKENTSSASRVVAQAFGYSEEELNSIPKEANMGLSCGNTIKIANLREGETVVDLGCGGGLDCFLAATKVGPKGQVIGVDMTEDMIQLAMKNAAKAGSKSKVCDFRKGDIEALPVDDGVADCVISNCVLNLVPDKRRAFAEIFRTLKPGGRLAASDIALKQPLPEDVRKDFIAYTGCIAGAILIDEYHRMLLEAGFSDVEIIDSQSNLNVYSELGTVNCCAPSTSECNAVLGSSGSCSTPSSSCCAPSASEEKGKNFGQDMKSVLEKLDVNAYAAAVKVLAVKPL
jgi:arsenite methyltransferase